MTNNVMQLVPLWLNVLNLVFSKRAMSDFTPGTTLVLALQKSISLRLIRAISLLNSPFPMQLFYKRKLVWTLDQINWSIWLFPSISIVNENQSWTQWLTIYVFCNSESYYLNQDHQLNRRGLVQWMLKVLRSS